MTNAHEDTGYTPADTYANRKKRAELVRERELDKIFSELDESIQKTVDMQSGSDSIESNKSTDK